MSVTHGMDVGEVRRLGGSLQSKADQLDRLVRDVERSVGGSSWVGPDATMFKTQWWPERKAQLLRASQDLHGLGQSALNNADEQDKASGEGGSGNAGSSALSPMRLAQLRSEASALESPADISKWWNGLSQAERDGLVAGDPHFVGNTDGIPPDRRYEANRTNIGSYVDELHDERAALVDRIERLPDENSLDLLNTGMPDSATKVSARSQLELQLTALDGKIEKFEGMMSEDRQIILFDPTVDDGRIAEVFGDLSKADDVAVVVPGISNSLDNYSADNANHLHEAARGETATIMWLGYDTPDGPLDGETYKPESAEQYASDLVSFTEGLKSTTTGEVAVVAHSYGTVLATEAAVAGMDVDRVVLLGSPGVGADNASVFNGAEVFAIKNEGDPVAIGDVHGTDPTDPGFGASVLEGNPSSGFSVSIGSIVGTAVQPFTGPVIGAAVQSFVGGEIDLGSHSTYFDPGSTSLENIIGAVETSEFHIADDGMRVTRSVDADGNVKITAIPTY